MSFFNVSGPPKIGSFQAGMQMYKDTRAPTSDDWRNWNVFDLWLHQQTDTDFLLYMLVSKSGNQAEWQLISNATASGVETLTGSSGGPISPDSGGNINLVGDEVTVTVNGKIGRAHV